ncbi:hypothetical protein BSL78_04029 [Apostichopus japonicus]|uniref:G-protein coupled receptors family 2 profile 2 domain-containing protein n=1 Tax=Stichopus japonicus TaxID=307972 RepID=A0A2G8LFR2_STIJA|nr:hypothetical protein BSL78_04029 [Apostichopus japonicus]
MMIIPRVVLLAVLTPSSRGMDSPDQRQHFNWTGEYNDLFNLTICPIYRCDGHNRSLEEPYHLCKCDDECLFYHDCCWGYNGNSVTPSHHTATKTKKTDQCAIAYRANVGTTTPDEWSTTAAGYRMVSTCPPDVQNRTLVQHCQDTGDVINTPLDAWQGYADHMPVQDHHTGKTYKNVHCAFCNFVRFEDMRFWQLTLSIFCDRNQPPLRCGNFFFEPMECNDTVAAVPRGCIHVDVESCPETANLTIKNLCDSYLAPYEFHGLIFRNPHCAFCNTPYGPFPPSSISYCPTLVVPVSRSSRGLPHTIPFNFFSSFGNQALHKPVIVCATGLTYNETTLSCELSESDFDRFICDRSNNNNGAIIEMVIGNEDRSRTTSDVEGIIQTINNAFFTSSSPQLQTGMVSCVNDKDKAIITCSTASPNISQFDNNLEPFIKELQRSGGIDVIRAELFIVCTSSFTLTSKGCTKLGIFENSDVTLASKDRDYYVTTLTENRIYTNAEVLRKYSSFRTSDETEDDLQFNLHISICESSTEDLLCPYTFLLQDEFSVANDELIRKSRTEISISQREYLLSSDGQVKVCLERLSSETSPQDDLFLLIIFIIFTTLSLLGLFLTFVNYCLLKELRNLPGKLTMNFIVATFLAQLLLLVSPANEVMCTLIAIFGHFIWLSTFIWTTVIAYNVTQTFGGTSSLLIDASVTSHLILRNTVIGWISPAMFVGICFVFQRSTILEERFDYGKGETCWLTPPLANFLLFGIPAILCLTCNIIFYVTTVRGIRDTKRTSLVATQTDESTLVKEEIVLFLKISVLMGLSWIWAILYGCFPQVTVLLYIHTFLNPSIGVFVFLIYVCNRRVISMWKVKLGKRNSQRATSQDASKQNIGIVKTASTSLSKGSSKDGNFVLDETKL